jgi:hypothetical protein
MRGSEVNFVNSLLDRFSGSGASHMIKTCVHFKMMTSKLFVAKLCPLLIFIYLACYILFLKIYIFDYFYK